MSKENEKVESEAQDNNSQDMSEGFHLKKEKSRKRTDSGESNNKVDNAGGSPQKREKQTSTLSKSKNNKKTPLIVIVFALVAIAAIGAVFFIANKPDESGNVTEGEPLSYAEDLEQYKLEEGASQSDHDTSNIRLAWAYYREDNYEKSLELLEAVQNPADSITSSYTELYGLVLNALGREEEAQKYNQITLEAREQHLINAASEAPIAYYSLGILYTNVGETDKAIESYEKYITTIESGLEKGVGYEGSEYLDLARQALGELQ